MEYKQDWYIDLTDEQMFCLNETIKERNPIIFEALDRMKKLELENDILKMENKRLKRIERRAIARWNNQQTR